MTVIGLFGAFASIGLLCWLLFSLAVYAVPTFIGLRVGLWAHETGADAFGALLAGLFSGGAAYGAARVLHASLAPGWPRHALALFFAGPAAFAGYSAAHGVAGKLMPSEGWQFAVAIVGALAVGGTAFVRLGSGTWTSAE